MDVWRKLLGFLSVPVLLASLGGDVEGHLPADVMYFAVQFPDTYLPVLDGDLSEWDIIPNAYMIYTEDMYDNLCGHTMGRCLDPTDLALRSCCGWNDSTNRLYFMAEVFDDIHQTDRTDPQCNWTDDCWEIVIDANHSGGRHAWFSDLTEEESKRLEGSQGTSYILAEPPIQQVDFTSGNASTWTSEPGDWFDIGWDFTGDEFGKSTYYYELFIYPFDDLNWEGPDLSTHHDLREGEIIGIGWSFADFDALSDSYDAYWTLSGGDATCGLSEALADMFISPFVYGIDGSLSFPTMYAAFTASRRSGHASLEVLFTDRSIGDIAQYVWSFGDGGSSTEQNPIHTYTVPGNYTVMLMVIGPEGSDTNTKADYITVTVEPLRVRLHDREAETPGAYRLSQNYPNPFNTETTIAYDVQEPGPVRVSVYALTGQLVRTLVDGERQAGSYSMTWDGRDNAGRAVATGVYVCRLEAREHRGARKMLMLK